MKFNLFVLELPIEGIYRWSFSIVEFSYPWMKYPTSLLHMEWKNKKLYWELCYSNLWLEKKKNSKTGEKREKN